MSPRTFHLTITLVALLALAFAPPAKATDFLWPHSEWGAPRAQLHQTAQRRRRPPIRYYASPRSEFDDADRVCRGPVRGVGTQWVGEEGALDAAKKDWRERTRYDHGEIFVDLSHATDFVKRCGRTSIGEVAGQVLFRCEIIARPCKAEFSEGTAGK